MVELFVLSFSTLLPGLEEVLEALENMLLGRRYQGGSTGDGSGAGETLNWILRSVLLASTIKRFKSRIVNGPMVGGGGDSGVSFHTGGSGVLSVPTETEMGTAIFFNGF